LTVLFGTTKKTKEEVPNYARDCERLILESKDKSEVVEQFVDHRDWAATPEQTAWFIGVGRGQLGTARGG